MRKKRFPLTFLKACYVKWLVNKGFSLTHAAIYCGLNVGTVSHVIHNRRFPGAPPSRTCSGASLGWGSVLVRLRIRPI